MLFSCLRPWFISQNQNQNQNSLLFAKYIQNIQGIWNHRTCLSKRSVVFISTYRQVQSTHIDHHRILQVGFGQSPHTSRPGGTIIKRGIAFFYSLYPTTPQSFLREILLRRERKCDYLQYDLSLVLFLCENENELHQYEENIWFIPC